MIVSKNSKIGSKRRKACHCCEPRHAITMPRINPPQQTVFCCPIHTYSYHAHVDSKVYDFRRQVILDAACHGAACRRQGLLLVHLL